MSNDQRKRHDADQQGDIAGRSFPVRLQVLGNTLAEADPKPAKMLFLNEAVTLTTEGSEVTDTLRGLEQAGVRIFSCGTCLDYFSLKEKRKVGVASNMFEILSTLAAAGHIINP